MSRLTSFLNRLTAQKLLLEQAAQLIDGVPGAIVDLGLGSGRTYDHMRHLFADREIFAFDGSVNAHPACIPRDGHLILGEIARTLPASYGRFEGPVALIHNDIGTADDLANQIKAEWLTPLIAPIMAKGGVVLTSFAMALPNCVALDPPPQINRRRYYIYHCVGGH